jgi:hypothetical protein
MKNACEFSKPGSNETEYKEAMKRNRSTSKSRGSQLAALLCFKECRQRSLQVSRVLGRTKCSMAY